MSQNAEAPRRPLTGKPSGLGSTPQGGGAGGGGGKGSPVPFMLNLLEGLGAGTATGLTGNPAFIQGLHAAQQDARRMAFQQEERERDEIAEAARSGSASFLSSPEVQRRMGALGMDPAVWAPIAQSAQRNRMMEEKAQGLQQQVSLAQLQAARGGEAREQASFAAEQPQRRALGEATEAAFPPAVPFNQVTFTPSAATPQGFRTAIVRSPTATVRPPSRATLEQRALLGLPAPGDERFQRRLQEAQLGAAQTEIAAGKERIVASREERAGRQAAEARAALVSLGQVFPGADPAAMSRVVTALSRGGVPVESDIAMLMRQAPPGVTPQALQDYLGNRIRITNAANELAALARAGQLDETSLRAAANANNNDALAALQVGLRTGTISPERKGQEARETMTFFSPDGATRMGLEEGARRAAAGEQIVGSPLEMTQAVGDQDLLDTLRPPPPPPAQPQAVLSEDTALGAINAGEGVVRSRMNLDTLVLRPGRADLTADERNQLQLLIQAIRSTAQVVEQWVGRPPDVFGPTDIGPNQRLTQLLRGAQRLLALPSGRERGSPRRGS